VGVLRIVRRKATIKVFICGELQKSLKRAWSVMRVSSDQYDWTFEPTEVARDHGLVGSEHDHDDVRAPKSKFSDDGP